MKTLFKTIIYLHFNKQYKGFRYHFCRKKHVESKRVFLFLPNITLRHDLFWTVAILSFPGIYSCQELLRTAESRLFQKSIQSRNCSALQHPVFSRNLFYSGTALLCSILSLPGIFSFQELLYSSASRLFQKSILSRNCSVLQHLAFARNLFYPNTALLCSTPSFPGIFLSRNRSAL